MRRACPLLALVAASCYTSATPPVEEAAPPPPPRPAFTIADAAVGPLTPKTPATLTGLRTALAGFDVRPAHVAFGESQHRLAYAVSSHGDKLLHVFADDAGAIFAIHAISAKVAVADRSWKVGQQLTSVRALSTCACWFSEVVVCFRAGDHVGIAIARACEDSSYATPEERQDLIGASIHRVLWSPTPYTEDSEPYGPPYGGIDL